MSLPKVSLFSIQQPIPYNNICAHSNLFQCLARNSEAESWQSPHEGNPLAIWCGNQQRLRQDATGAKREVKIERPRTLRARRSLKFPRLEPGQLKFAGSTGARPWQQWAVARHRPQGQIRRVLPNGKTKPWCSNVRLKELGAPTWHGTKVRKLGSYDQLPAFINPRYGVVDSFWLTQSQWAQWKRQRSCSKKDGRLEDFEWQYACLVGRSQLQA